MSLSQSQLISLHDAFWNHTLKEPIVNTCCSQTSRINSLFNYQGKKVIHDDWKGGNFLLEPDMLIPSRHHYYPDFCDWTGGLICGPVFKTEIPWTMVPWLAGIVGCKILANSESQTIWAEPVISENWYDMKNYGLKPNKKWLEKLVEFTEYLLIKNNGKKCVSLEFFSRGPGDLLINLLGAERACIEMYDHEKELKNLLLLITELHIEWAEAQLQYIPELNGGYVNQWGIWAPGKVTRIQEDFSQLLSERHFKEFLLPCEEKITHSISYQVFHTHSGNPNIADWLLELQKLKVIEVTVDPTGPSLEELIPLWNRILKKKSLIISASLFAYEVDMLVKELNPEGLMLDVELVRKS